MSTALGFSTFVLVPDPNDPTLPPTPTLVAASLDTTAMEIAAFPSLQGPLAESGFTVINRGFANIPGDIGSTFTENALFEFDPDDGRILGATRIGLQLGFGFGSDVAEVGRINTTPILGRAPNQVGNYQRKRNRL